MFDPTKLASIKDMDIEGKRVLVRVDFNVSIKNGMVEDDTRLRATIPTINYLLENNCKIVLMSHLGRPQKAIKNGMSHDEAKKQFTLKPVAEDLADILGVEVGFVDDCVDEEIPKNVDVILLENVRLHKEEEANDDDFSRRLAQRGNIYVNDAFGASHRKHASVCGVTNYIPSCTGLLVEKEIAHLNKLLQPEKPFVAVVGGAKADKIGALKTLLSKADAVLLGGVLSLTFLKAKGIDIGGSKWDEETFTVAKDIIASGGDKLKLPIDAIVADQFSTDAKTDTVSISAIPKKWLSLDIGPKTVAMYQDILKDAKTVLWAGPLGVFEMEPFSHGTKSIAEYLGDLEASVVCGGGDTSAMVEQFELNDKIGFVSTGGGASLEFIEKKGKLPAFEALQEAFRKANQE